MTYETKQQPETAQAFCDSLKVPYAAQFVPQSLSRNADSEHKSLNWAISFGGLQTDYMQGIGHLPGYNFGNRSVSYQDRVRDFACEQGLQVSSEWPHRVGKKLAPPLLRDVLYSLVMDSDVLDYPCFAEWAEAFGYDSDSIAAKDVYEACLRNALRLRQLIDLDKARAAFEDY